MSTQEAETTSTEALDTLPEFELECLFDDIEDPSELTIFTRGAETATRWITVDIDHAVPLSEIR